MGTKPESKVLTLFTLFKGDVAVAARAFPGEDPVASGPDLSAAMDEVGADGARSMGTIELPPGNVATAVEHDYAPDGTKTRVGVWRNDERGGLWRAPWVDYRFVVTDEVGTYGGPLPVLEAMMLAQRISVEQPLRDIAVRWYHEGESRGRRVATFSGGSDQF